MNLEGKTCTIAQFSLDGALLQTQSDLVVISDAFHEELTGQLAKAGLLLQEPHPLLGPAEFTLEGQFVRVDEGNRALRYFLTFLAGAATVEAEGQLYHGDWPVTPLHSKAQQTIGLFGGSGLGLLKTCTRTAAAQIANQVIEALTER